MPAARAFELAETAQTFDARAKDPTAPINGATASLAYAVLAASINTSCRLVRTSISAVWHPRFAANSAVTPFTFSLLAYPMIIFTLWGPQRKYRYDGAIRAIGTGFTLFARTVVAIPRM